MVLVSTTNIKQNLTQGRTVETTLLKKTFEIPKTSKKQVIHTKYFTVFVRSFPDISLARLRSGKDTSIIASMRLINKKSFKVAE